MMGRIASLDHVGISQTCVIRVVLKVGEHSVELSEAYTY